MLSDRTIKPTKWSVKWHPSLLVSGRRYNTNNRAGTCRKRMPCACAVLIIQTLGLPAPDPTAILWPGTVQVYHVRFANIIFLKGAHVVRLPGINNNNDNNTDENSPQRDITPPRFSRGYENVVPLFRAKGARMTYLALRCAPYLFE
ncbi:hypothetical protein ElyMa_003177600 [Elysia marginata]|uniref:Uncharacterized protein n=1 Tax=Elysia marginata TaxID=1093978 RepID=A0AAV4J2Y0_9GAST|nr:hypothetical protein ElyMa_003177600 [Elysia marginata]